MIFYEIKTFLHPNIAQNLFRTLVNMYGSCGCPGDMQTLL